MLDINLHRKVAILVMEAFSKHISERQQGAFVASTLSVSVANFAVFLLQSYIANPKSSKYT